MKISLNNTSNPYTNPSNVAKRDSSTANVQNNSRNFDAVTIQSDPTQVAERKFAGSLSASLSSEVRQPTAPEKIDSLKNQVEQGTYPIDAGEIASKILLLGDKGDENA